MAGLDLRSLRLLLWAKRRRLAALEAQVQAAGAVLAQANAALAQATQRHMSCMADQAACAARIDAMRSSVSFRPDEIVLLGHVLDGLADLTRQAGEAKDATEAACQKAQALLDEAKRIVQRASQQIEQLEDKRIQRLKEIDQEGEDIQDEESEEAAVARRVAQRREAAAVAAAEASA